MIMTLTTEQMNVNNSINRAIDDFNVLDQIKSMDLSFKFVFGPKPKYDKIVVDFQDKTIFSFLPRFNSDGGIILSNKHTKIRQFNKWLKSLDTDPDTANLKYHHFMVSSHTSELLLYIVHLRHTYYKN
jgi:hypothetical protein